MALCEICGKEEVIPFICLYCGKAFCAEHRLPESHGCTLAPKTQPAFNRADGFVASQTQRSAIRTSRTEVMHLSIGIIIFFLVEYFDFIRYFSSMAIMFVVAGGAVLAFVSHELAHKLTAQHYGLWSEFRLDPIMAVVSLITALPFIPIKIIAPGAVVIYGYRVTLEQMGKTSVSGSLVNIAQAVLFYMVAPLRPELILVADINAYLALFNLLPFSVLDGQKVLAWNKAVWLLTFAGAVALWIWIVVI